MNDLLENVYLPDLAKRDVRESDAYKLLEENKMDTSILEGHETSNEKAKHYDSQVVMEGFDNFISQGGNKVDWINKHATPEVQAEYFSNIGDFLVDTGKDTVLSLATAVVNGADVATNLMPLFVKALDKAPLAIGMPEGFLNEANEKQIYDFANNVSNNLGEARDYLNEFKKDDNFVSQLVGVMGQDLLYSVPIYNNLRKAGVPKYWSFLISGGVGGAIGIEDKIMGAESTFSQEFFEKDIVALKDLIGIIPNTPEDKIADEVVQALEYGAFSVAIPAIIDAFKFGKRFIPAMTTTATGTTALTIDNEAEGSPIKAIVNAVTKAPVFKSSVIDAASKIPNVASGDQIFNTIKNTSGVKANELKWMDLEAFLKGKKKVSKEEVLTYIEANRIDVTEVMFPRTGKDFGMYDEMLQSAEQRQVKLMEDYFDEKGIAMNNDQYAFFNRNTDGDTLATEKFDFSSFERTDVGKTIDSFRDVNTFNYDLDAIQDIYKSKRGKKYVEFYMYEDNVSGKIRALSQGEIGLPPPKKLDVDPNSGGTFEFSYSTDISVNDLKKYAAEGEIRELKRLRSQQEGTTRYGKYTEPGGEDYKELILKYRQLGELEGRKPIPLETGVTKYDNIDNFDIAESPHFNEPNELAHVRFKTRTLDNGKKLLAVEEMQSDLVQAVKQNNELSSVAGSDYQVNAETIKDFPFKNSWYELAIKRLTRYAADNGFDAISIPKGSTIQDRYQLTKRIDDFEIGSFDLARKEVGLDATDQNGVLQISNLYKFDEVEKEFGKDVLDRIISKGKTLKQADYDDGNNILKFNKPLIIGGEGKNSLYDKALPAYLKKYAKKWNAKVYDDNISTGTKPLAETNETQIPVTILELSPEMKTGVTSSSQPLFEIFGTVGLSTWAANEVSDNMKNNIISQTTN